MKAIKFLTVLFMSMAVMSCSSDDSSSSSGEQDQIIGTWVQFKKTQYNADGSVKGVTNNSEDECYGLTTYQYKANGDWIKDSYDYDLTCIHNPIRTGSWENNGNGTYTITSNGIETISNITFSGTSYFLKVIPDAPATYAYEIVEFIPKSQI